MIDDAVLAGKATELLATFHARRLAKLEKVALADLLKKNPYLYRAIGHAAASDYIRAALDALVSSSDETIFGNVFFEPLAKWAAVQAHRGLDGVSVQAGGGAGFDVSIETPTEYKAIAVKSGTKIFNAQSGKQQDTELDALHARIRKEKKVFHPIIGYGYGRKRQLDENPKVLKLAGQSFWAEITGEDEFYQRISEVLGNKPTQLAVEFDVAYGRTRSRLEKAFSADYVDSEGQIDWTQVIVFNSARTQPARALRSKNAIKSGGKVAAAE